MKKSNFLCGYCGGKTNLISESNNPMELCFKCKACLKNNWWLGE